LAQTRQRRRRRSREADTSGPARHDQRHKDNAAEALSHPGIQAFLVLHKFRALKEKEEEEEGRGQLETIFVAEINGNKIIYNGTERMSGVSLCQ
jgi:hypothetical protein